MKSLLNKIAPKTLTAQFMWVITLVLIIAQAVNLVLLVDAKRLHARGNIVSSALTNLVRGINLMNELSGKEFRHDQEDKSEVSIKGFIISSRFNSVESHLPPRTSEYDELIEETLYQNDIEVLTSRLFIGHSADIDLDELTRGSKLIQKNNDSNPCLAPSSDEDQLASETAQGPPGEGPPHGNSGEGPPHGNPGEGPPHGPPGEMPQHGSAEAPPAGMPVGQESLDSSQNHPPPPPPPSYMVSETDVEEYPETIILAVEMCEDIWAIEILPHRTIESLTPKILSGTLALLFLTLLTVSLFMRQITKPLSRLTAAVDDFGRGQQPRELNESGPVDIKKATKAFNRMQRRLNRTVETQRTMLRAVGHDLRTPLTSMRIRSEMIPEELNRDKFISTIDEMTKMTEELLAWTKNLSGVEDVASVELNALLSSVVEDFRDQGHDITYEDIEKTSIRTRRLAMKRALGNVLSNAVKYAGAAHVHVTKEKFRIMIHVDDNGPGIPEEQMEAVLKPFVRLESSRNRGTGGTGLGLSISATILHTEGGQLKLQNRDSGGLRVTLVLAQ